jgi:hypothetical protein
MFSAQRIHTRVDDIVEIVTTHLPEMYDNGRLTTLPVMGTQSQTGSRL